MFSWDSCVCKPVSLHPLMLFLWVFFPPFVLCYPDLFVLFYLIVFCYCPCFLPRAREGMDLDGREDGEEQGEVTGNKTIIWIYCMKSPFSV